MKRFTFALAMMLTFALLASAQDKSFNATGLPIVSKPTTLKVFFDVYPEQNVPFNDMPVVKMLEKQTGVHIEWITAPTAERTSKINLLFAANDLPDIFLTGMTVPQAFAYSDEKTVIPLDDLVNKYAPTIKSFLKDIPGLKETVTSPDGKMYTLFSLANAYHQDLGNMVYVNKTWLAKVGMKVPTTTEEFYQVLKAFKGKDLNGNGIDDEIPLGLLFYKKNANWSDLNFFGSFGLQMDPMADFFALEKGKVVWEPSLPGFRKTLEWLNKLYKEGLIDPEAYIQDRAQMQAKGGQKPPRYGFYVSWFASNVGGLNADDYVAIGPLKGPEGQQLASWHPRALGLGGFGVITSAAKNPEVAMRWLDYIYQPEINIQLGYGILGEALEKTKDNVWKFLPPPTGVTSERFRMVNSLHHMPYTYPAKLKTEDPLPFQLKDKAKDELFLKYLPKDRALPVFYMAKKDQETYDSIYPDLTSFVDQKWAVWVMKGLTNQDWDAYQKQLKAMGLDKILAIQQKGYDTLMSFKK